MIIYIKRMDNRSIETGDQKCARKEEADNYYRQ